MTFRGLWARRALAWALFVVAAVAVGGTVVLQHLARQQNASGRWAAPLLVVALAAVPYLGRELAGARRQETAVARLRGLHGARLWRWFTAEPLVVLLAGGLVGYVVALLSGAGRPGPYAVLALAIVVAGTIGVLTGAAAGLREPLPEQFRGPVRPHATGTMALFWQLLLIAAAVVAVLRARSAPGDDVVVLAGPALVGLAIGQIAIWVVRLVGRAAIARTRGSALPAFLGARRLARAGQTGPLRVLVAAAAVGGLALSGAHAVDDYVDQTARVQTASGFRFTWADARAIDALRLTHAADPRGRYLMAAEVLAARRSGSDRVAFVDSGRYRAVVADSLAGTPAAGVTSAVDRLHGRTVTLLMGDTLEVAIDRVRSLQDLGGVRMSRRIDVTLDYVDGANAVNEVTARVPLAPTQTSGSAKVALPGCAHGCSVVSFGLEQQLASQGRPVAIARGLQARIVRARAGDDDLLGHSWTHQADVLQGYTPIVGKSSIRQRGGTATVSVAAGAVSTFGPAGAAAPLPVVTTLGGHVGGEGAGGDERRTRVVARADALPLLEGEGTIADLSTALDGAAGTPPEAKVLVLARADTPPAVLAKVRAVAGAPRTVAQTRSSVEAAVGGARSDAYLLTAAGSLLVGLCVAFAWVGRQRESYRVQVAALRVIGVDAATSRRATRWELGLLGAVAAVASVAAWVLTVRSLLVHLPLVDRAPYALPLTTSLGSTAFAVTILLVIVVVMALGRGRRSTAAASRPATLREEAAR